MANFFIGTEAQCIAIVSKLNNLLGYPNKKTLTYAIPRQHHTNPTQWFIPIKLVNGPILGRKAIMADYTGRLSAGELTVISHDTMLANGAWRPQTL